MLETPFATARIKINDVCVPCNFVKLGDICMGNLGLPLYNVNGRYKTTINTTGLLAPFSVTCEFWNNPQYEEINVEPGEQLVLKSWYQDNLKISIGTYDDENGDKGFSVECLDYGLKITTNENYKMSELIFCIAWVYMNDIEKEDIYTWFAADPSYSD